MLLDRYIARALFGGVAVVLLVMVALMGFVDFVNELDDVGKGNYDLLQAVVHVALNLPRRLYEIFSTAVLIGGLLGLGVLASNSELVVMRAAGVSIRRIAKSTLQAGLVLSLLVALVGEFLVPPSVEKAESIRNEALHRKISFGSDQGIWAREQQFYINVRKIYPDLQLEEIHVYELGQDQQLKQAISARSAVYKSGQWELRDIQRSIITSESVRVEHVAAEIWPRLLSPDLFEVVSAKPQNMSAGDLYKYSQYLKANNLDSSHYQLAFWRKITTPISTLVMLLLALPFVFGSVRSGGSGQRIFYGILIGIGFYMLNNIVSHTGQVYGLHPLVSAFAPLIMVAAVGLFVLKRIR